MARSCQAGAARLDAGRVDRWQGVGQALQVPGRDDLGAFRTCAGACAIPWLREHRRGLSPDEPADPTVGDWDGEGINFGEQGAKTDVTGTADTCSLPRLLSAQQLESDPPAHDELLFITVHQVYELWFQQVLFEAEAVREAMFEDQVWLAKHLLRRIHAIERVLIAQIDILETMTPQDFLAFRQHLAPASGFQSVQFRELEFISGAKDQSFVQRFKGLTDDETDRLARRLEEPTLWDAFLALLAGRGLAVASDEQVRTSLNAAAHDRGYVLRRVGAGRGADRARRALDRLAGPTRDDG